MSTNKMPDNDHCDRITPETFRDIGFGITKKATLDSFTAHFMVNPATCSKIWHILRSSEFAIALSGLQPEHILWTLAFMTMYGSACEEVISSMFSVTEKECFTHWVEVVVNLMAKNAERIISWESRLSQPPSSSNHSNCNAVIGPVFCRLLERRFPGERDYFSDEGVAPKAFFCPFVGGMAVAYTIGVSTASGELVFVSEQWPGAWANPFHMLRDDVFPRLVSGEVVGVPDRPYARQFLDKIVTLPSPGKSVVRAQRPCRAKSRRAKSCRHPAEYKETWVVPAGVDELKDFRNKLHEAMHLFYGFGCLHNDFRHGLDKQKNVFFAAAFVVQAMLQNRDAAE